jgi:GT2 family glycosyltransferase
MPPAPALSSLSIVVPTHDTRELTLRCLETMLGAPPPGGLEVILVDDGSADGTTAEVGRRFPEVAIVRHERAEGFTRSANDGLARARGDLFLLLNSDTEVAPGALARLVEAFAGAPRMGIAGAALHYPDGRPQWSGGAEPSCLWLFALASGLPALLARLPGYRRARPLAVTERRTVDWVTGAALALRRAVWEEVGPLDERFGFYAQDLDLCVRARAADWEVALLPEVRVLHHHGATIGRRGDAVSGQHLGLLWSDLLRQAVKHRGPGRAARARCCLRAGAVLRRAGLGFAGLLRPAARRRLWAERRALGDALAALVISGRTV